ncbi:hypothetical protein KQI38_03330 [Tissierella carlieri]|nr:hypothetical protein [Tissierella carlieri]MBU5311045.1 hypothetical protein [Tissierella carlieri]
MLQRKAKTVAARKHEKNEKISEVASTSCTLAFPILTAISQTIKSL